MRVAGMIPHVFCPDPEATARWLGEFLGLSELSRATDADGTVVQLRLDSPGGRVWLERGTPAPAQWTGFMIDDLDAARAALGSAAGAPEALPDGGRFATVTDPSGLAWRLVESTPRPAHPKLSAVLGDITTQEVDAIVNAANSSLLGGGGVDGAIHTAAGPRLVEYCRGLGGCKVGESKTSPGFDLAAQYVIHTVGPIWHDGTHGEPELLASCYRTALAEADANGATSIAFPAISTGIFGYPVEAAAKVAVSTIRETATNVTEVRFVAFDQRTFDAYEAQLAGV